MSGKKSASKLEAAADAASVKQSSAKVSDAASVKQSSAKVSDAASVKQSSAKVSDAASVKQSSAKVSDAASVKQSSAKVTDAASVRQSITSRASKMPEVQPSGQVVSPSERKSAGRISVASKLPDELGGSKFEVAHELVDQADPAPDETPEEPQEEVLSLKIGIIGGTGLDDPDILENRVAKPCTNQFGEVSGGYIVEGDIHGVPCVLISRHGPQHNINPSNVNYRANIWALKEAKCTHVLATTATGSLSEDIKPGDFVILDDFIDRTQHRVETFYDGTETGLAGVFHLPSHPPFSQPVREAIVDAAADIGLEAHDGGTVITIEGPRFSSRAESRMYQQWGASVVNMSTVPEVVLAKEAGLMYGAIALATDYDCWKEGEQAVSHEYVQQTFAENVDNLQELLIACVIKIKELDWMKDYMIIQEARDNMVPRSCLCKPKDVQSELEGQTY